MPVIISLTEHELSTLAEMPCPPVTDLAGHFSDAAFQTTFNRLGIYSPDDLDDAAREQVCQIVSAVAKIVFDAVTDALAQVDAVVAKNTKRQ